MKNIDEILDEIREAAFQLEAQGAESKKIIILAPKYFTDMLQDEFEKMTGDKVNKEAKMTLFGYRVFPSFENKITVYDEDIVGDLKRLPIKIELNEMIIIEEEKQTLNDIDLLITTMEEEIAKVEKDIEEATKLHSAIIELKSKGFKVMFPVNGWKSF